MKMFGHEYVRANTCLMGWGSQIRTLNDEKHRLGPMLLRHCRASLHLIESLDKLHLIVDALLVKIFNSPLPTIRELTNDIV